MNDSGGAVWSLPRIGDVQRNYRATIRELVPTRPIPISLATTMAPVPAALFWLLDLPGSSPNRSLGAEMDSILNRNPALAPSRRLGTFDRPCWHGFSEGSTSQHLAINGQSNTSRQRLRSGLHAKLVNIYKISRC